MHFLTNLRIYARLDVEIKFLISTLIKCLLNIPLLFVDLFFDFYMSKCNHCNQL